MMQVMNVIPVTLCVVVSLSVGALEDDAGVQSLVGTPTNVGHSTSETLLRSRMKQVLSDPDRYLVDIGPLLGEIQVRRLIEYRKDLDALLMAMRQKEQSARKAVVKNFRDKRKMTMGDIAVTAIWLEMCEQNISGEKECVAFMVGRIRELAAKRQSFDGPALFLEANIERLWPHMLARFDEAADDDTQGILLDALRVCSDARLEDELMARARLYTNKPQIFDRLLWVMGAVGSDKSLAYLRAVADTGTPQQKEVASSVLATKSALKGRRLFQYSGQWSTNAWPR
jgi:hypothetical protein